MNEMAIYLNVLRQRRGMTQEHLAKLLGVDQRLVQRWLSEGKPMKFDMWRKVIRALRASPEDAIKLMDDENATPDDARSLAMQLLGREIRAERYAKDNAVLDEDDKLLDVVIAELEAHPEMIRPVIGLLSGLRSVPRPLRKPQQSPHSPH